MKQTEKTEGDIRERIVKKLKALEKEMREVKREDMQAKDDTLDWMRWGKFCVYLDIIEDVSTQLEFMWFFPYGIDGDKEFEE